MCAVSGLGAANSVRNSHRREKPNRSALEAGGGAAVKPSRRRSQGQHNSKGKTLMKLFKLVSSITELETRISNLAPQGHVIIVQPSELQAEIESIKLRLDAEVEAAMDQAEKALTALQDKVAAYDTEVAAT
jgi:hypothetical protein